MQSLSGAEPHDMNQCDDKHSWAAGMRREWWGNSEHDDPCQEADLESMGSGSSRKGRG